MKKHLSLLVIGFLLGILVFGFINFNETQTIQQTTLSGLLGVFVSYLVFFSNHPLNNIVPWKKLTGLRILLGIVINTLSAYLLILAMLWFYSLINPSAGSNVLDNEVLLKLVILLLCGSLIYNIAYFTFYSYNYFAREQLSELKNKRKQAELQLATLKAQLSPHFLFNCINSLSALFHVDIPRAETFIRAMAKSYQYTLANYKKSLMKVEEEVAFLESYAFLLKTRFKDSFELKINLGEKHLNSKIPPLTLQILVENAIKHNITGADSPVFVSIVGNGTSISITNNKVDGKRIDGSTGIGLKNISARYKILVNSKINIDDKAGSYTVTLPLLQ